MEMTDVKEEFSAEELRLRKALVKALWTVENKEREFSSPAERHAAFVEERSPYQMKATQVLRQLKSQNVTLGLVDEF